MPLLRTSTRATLPAATTQQRRPSRKLNRRAVAFGGRRASGFGPARLHLPHGWHFRPTPPPPSVIDSDAEARAARPVHITGIRDIRSARREGCPVADPGFTLRAQVDPAALNTVRRSRWCGVNSDGGC